MVDVAGAVIRDAEPDDEDELVDLAVEFATSFTVDREHFGLRLEAMLEDPATLLRVAICDGASSATSRPLRTPRCTPTGPSAESRS